VGVGVICCGCWLIANGEPIGAPTPLTPGS